MHDPYNLSRFRDTQRSVADTVTYELRAGRKQTHWMWYVFPQIAGLGKSDSARFYALGSVDEARAYLAHPDLGPQLRQWTQLVVELDGVTAQDIFGPLDALKFRSSMTLFAMAANQGSVFEAALDKYFAGQPCPRTRELCK